MIKKSFTALALVTCMGIGAVLSATQADAADIQPLPFPTYVNGSQVILMFSCENWPRQPIWMLTLTA